MKPFFFVMLSLVVVSSSFAQLPYTEEQVIAYAKSIDVQTLDPSLPSQRLEDWLKTGPPHVHTSWRVADSCELKDPDIPYAVCAHISVYRDGHYGNPYGQKGYFLVQVGNSRDGITGRPKLWHGVGVWEGTFINTGSSERLSDLPSLLDQPVVADGVQKLYEQIVARRPIGIPRGSTMENIHPYLSKRLAEQFDTAQACQDDYRRQHPMADKTSQPGWMNSGLFSGDGSHASPVAAGAHKKEKLNDGAFLVYVILEPAEAVIHRRHGQPMAFYGGNEWELVTRVVSENGQFVVDDVRIFDGFPAEGPSHLLSDSFAGCDGPHWIGTTARQK